MRQGSHGCTTGIALKTKLLTPPGGKYPNFNVELRRRLGLFASVRPIRNVAGLPVGNLTIDRIAGDGKPVARLELPFDRVEVPTGGRDFRRLVVVRGDNLWNIARAHYGTGYHHTVIYGANKEQIRNPDLIYPGQVFSLPKVN